MTVRSLPALISIAVLACACSSKQTATPEWASPATGKSAAGDTAPTGAKAKSVRVTSVIVRQESTGGATGNGVAADVYRQGDTTTIFVSVDDSGKAAPDKACTPADAFTVTPKTAAYLQIAAVPCASTLEFELPSAEATYALIVKGDDALKSGNFAVAQQFYSIAADRFKVSQPAQAATLRNQAHIAADKALQMKVPTGNQTGAKPSVETRIREFQSRSGLPASGQLDTQTAQALSGVSRAEALRSAAQVPQNRIQEVMRAQSQPAK